ncbi:MAG: hypothetical protein NZ805_04795 [Armatimonadetes bacterium]|nr:hypothetical protein [Armatimonadota bacterium]MDW8027808.1 hypothetical protein [Armatimonadota bacterium]
MELDDLNWEKASAGEKTSCPKTKGNFPPNEGWCDYIYIPPSNDASKRYSIFVLLASQNATRGNERR